MANWRVLFSAPAAVLFLSAFLSHLRPSSAGKTFTSVNKWFKVACVAEHLRETDHYICDDHGYVHCLPGWANEKYLCEEAICDPECVPGQGWCDAPNTCSCEVGWTSADCSTCICLPGCVNGNCTIPFECICNDGWHGMLCDKPICKEGCRHGHCSKPGECICHPGWIGPHCDICITLPGCKDGYCNKPMECTCHDGYHGNFCEKPTCRPGCHPDYGYCKVPGNCACRPGWQGENCDICSPYPGCQNGFCELPWECRCNPGFHGPLCDIPGDAPSTPKPPHHGGYQDLKPDYFSPIHYGPPLSGHLPPIHHGLPVHGAGPIFLEPPRGPRGAAENQQIDIASVEAQGEPRFVRENNPTSVPSGRPEPGTAETTVARPISAPPPPPSAVGSPSPNGQGPSNVAAGGEEPIDIR